MIALSASPLRPDLIQAAVSSPDCGATICFIGTARNTRAFPAGAADRAVRALSYEAYAPMAISEMAEIRAEALTRWPGARVAMVHRTGTLRLEEAAVVIAISTPHRAAAYEASRWCIEQLKARVPIWKQEIGADGAAWTSNRP